MAFDKAYQNAIYIYIHIIYIHVYKPEVHSPMKTKFSFLHLMYVGPLVRLIALIKLVKKISLNAFGSLF